MSAYLSNTPVLTTERLTIRAPQPGDEAYMIPFAMSDRAKWAGGGSEFGLGRAWRMFAIIAGHWIVRGYGTFIYCDRETGRPLGGAGPWHPGDWPEQELGWTIWDPADEGRGLAHEAMVAIRDYTFRELKWETAVSYITVGNTRSRALAKRLGCALDETAPPPYPDTPTWVFRHPTPGALS